MTAPKVDEYQILARVSEWFQYAIVAIGVLSACAALTLFFYERPKNPTARKLTIFLIVVSLFLVGVTFVRERIDQRAEAMARSIADARVAEASKMATSAYSLASAQAPRMMSDAQIARFDADLAAGEKGDADVLTASGDGETKQLSNGITYLLGRAGWAISFRSGLTLGDDVVGVRLVVADQTTPPRRAITLLDALNRAGIVTSLASGPRSVPLSIRDPSKDYVQIVVGRKP